MRITKLLPTSRVARVAISLAVLASLVAISVIVAGATGSVTEDPFALNARSYASDFGTTFDEALRRLRLQEEIGTLDSQLSRHESGTFAGLWIQHEPEFKVIAKFTGNGETTIRPYIDGGNLENLVNVGTAPFTLASLRSAQASAIEAGRTVNATFEAGINVFDNRVEIYTLGKDTLESDLEGSGLAFPGVVDIVEVGRLSEPTANIYGGLALSKCTSGFAVEDSEGTKGITTAAHCTGNIYRDGLFLPKRGQYWGESGDVQWRTAPDFTVENKIKAGSNTIEITGTVEWDDQPIASYVCKQGKWTGYGCGHISDKSFLRTDDCPGGCTWEPTFVRVNASTGQKLSENEDSGGPFFAGSQAWGTMAAKLEIEDENEEWVRNDAVYMPIDYLEVLDIEVLTD